MKWNGKYLGTTVVVTLILFSFTARLSAGNMYENLREWSVETMRKAAIFFRTKVASHGGYVYYYSIDLKQRWGEVLAGQPKFKLNTPYISSEVFSRNIETLSEYLIATQKN